MLASLSPCTDMARHREGHTLRWKAASVTLIFPPLHSTLTRALMKKGGGIFDMPNATANNRGEFNFVESQS